MSPSTSTSGRRYLIVKCRFVELELDLGNMLALDNNQLETQRLGDRCSWIKKKQISQSMHIIEKAFIRFVTYRFVEGPYRPAYANHPANKTDLEWVSNVEDGRGEGKGRF